MKLFNLPQPIVPLRQTRETLGYSDAQIARMEADDAKQEAQHAALFKLPTAAGEPTGQPTGQLAGAPDGEPGGSPNPAAA